MSPANPPARRRGLSQPLSLAEIRPDYRRTGRNAEPARIFKNIGAVVGAGMPALGIYGMSSMLTTAAVATKTIGEITMGTAASAAVKAATVAGATVLGVPLMTAIGIGAAVLGIGTRLSFSEQRQSEQYCCTKDIPHNECRCRNSRACNRRYDNRI